MAERTPSRTRRTTRGGADPAAIDLGSDKLYFKIGEVAEIVAVPAYVLRYWENEFHVLRPQKSRTQQRVYRRKDVETLLRIKHLLYERKFTIAGARRELSGRSENPEEAVAKPNLGYVVKQSILRLRAHCAALADALHADSAATADPAAYVRAQGGPRGIVAVMDRDSTPQPLLERPQRETR